MLLHVHVLLLLLLLKNVLLRELCAIVVHCCWIQVSGIKVMKTWWRGANDTMVMDRSPHQRVGRRAGRERGPGTLTLHVLLFGDLALVLCLIDRKNGDRVSSEWLIEVARVVAVVSVHGHKRGRGWRLWEIASRV